ncbi:MAG: 2-amino-4-hydroxy-6-hydroxymethyldihydropteridine diphosphokinase [Betaproteobacteria bacterium]
MRPESAVKAYIGLGSNLEMPDRQLAGALEALAGLPGTRVEAVSAFYRTAPIGFAGQPDFVNAVARIETLLAARDLLDRLLAIEREHGRVREHLNGPRTLDLDLLLYGDHELLEDGLTVPHPRMHQRAFVMVPLAELAPALDIQGRGRADDLAASLSLTQRIERLR